MAAPSYHCDVSVCFVHPMSSRHFPGVSGGHMLHLESPGTVAGAITTCFS